MDDNEKSEQGGSFRGFDTPGEDEILPNSNEAIPSPSITSRQRIQPPDDFIGGEVNAKPGSSNPALDETLGFEEGKNSTADLLRARESAEEERPRAANRELYADQSSDEPTTGNTAYVTARETTEDGDPELGIYENREFNEPTEPSELDMLGVNMPNLPAEESDGR
jgi:hypothetical protein